MHARFFRIYSEEDLLDRVFLLMHDAHVYLPMDTDLRTLLYLSNKAEQERANKNKAAQTAALRNSSR